MNKIINRNKITHASIGNNKMFWLSKWAKIIRDNCSPLASAVVAANRTTEANSLQNIFAPLFFYTNNFVQEVIKTNKNLNELRWV